MGILVGRDSELRRLEELAEVARKGDRVTVLVDGVAGIGKSRLVEEAIEGMRRPADVVAVGHGVELSGGEIPYGTLADCLRSLVRAVGADNVREAAGRDLPVLAAVCPILGAPAELDRAQLFRAVVALVEQLATTRLVCLVFEDLQWVDAYTRDLVAYLIRAAAPGRLMIVLTLRTPEPAMNPPLSPGSEVPELTRDARLEHLALHPLSKDDVARQAAAFDPHSPPHPRTLQRLTSLSGGVPFLVEQLLLAGLSASGPVPASVWEPMRDRVMDLPASTRRLVQVASLVDGSVQHHLLELAYRDPIGLGQGDGESRRGADFTSAVAGAVRNRLLVFDSGDRSYAFTHALLREAVVSTITPTDRMAWHRCWARQLSRSEALARDPSVRVTVAQHWARADAPVEAFDAALEAAVYCARYGARREVASLMQQALSLWDRVSDAERRAGQSRDDLLVRACIALSACDAEEEILSLLDTELVRPDAVVDPRRELCLRVLHADARDSAGHDSDPRIWDDAVENVDALLSAPPSRLTCRALRWIGAHVSESDPERGQEIRRAILGFAGRLEDLELQRGTTIDMVTEACFRGRFDDAVDLCRQLPSAASATVVDRSEEDQTLAVVLYHGGRYADAETLLRRAQSRLPDPDLSPFLWRGNELGLVESLIAMGRWQEARQHLGLLSDHLEPSGPLTAWTARSAGVLACHTGDLDTALEWATTMHRCVPPTETAMNAETRAAWRHLDAEVAFLQSGAEPARALLQPLWGTAGLERVMDVWLVFLFAARLEADIAHDNREDRNDGRALAALQEAAATLPRFTILAQAWWSQLQAEFARARVGDDAAQWAECVDRWRGVAHVPWLAYALCRYGGSCLAQGARAEAGEALAEAFEITARLGAEPLSTTVLEVARHGRIKLPVSPDHRQAHGSIRARLTDREVDVLRLVAQGLSNGEIAETLFISPKTVSVHVSRILTKLQVPSRTRASALAYAEGIVDQPHR